MQLDMPPLSDEHVFAFEREKIWCLPLARRVVAPYGGAGKT